MDFFERWFGWSPDGGDGTTEMWYLGAAIVFVISVIIYAYYRRQRVLGRQKQLSRALDKKGRPR